MSAGNYMTMGDSARFAFISTGDQMFMDDLMFADDRMSMGDFAKYTFTYNGSLGIAMSSIVHKYIYLEAPLALNNRVTLAVV